MVGQTALAANVKPCLRPMEGPQQRGETEMGGPTAVHMKAYRQISFRKLRESGIVLGVAALAVVWALFVGPVGIGAGVSNVAPGRNLFRANCAACHGPDGAGNTRLAKSMKVTNLHSLVVQKKSDAQLSQVITNGAGDMPSFKDSLSDDQIRSLVAYLRALSKKK